MLHKCLGYFLSKYGYGSIMAKNGLGYILGDFLTNSSGHPVRMLSECGFLAKGFASRTQSYDRELQRQRCKFLQRYIYPSSFLKQKFNLLVLKTL
jgi:hypothetical protein